MPEPCSLVSQVDMTFLVVVVVLRGGGGVISKIGFFCAAQDGTELIETCLPLPPKC